MNPNFNGNNHVWTIPMWWSLHNLILSVHCTYFCTSKKTRPNSTLLSEIWANILYWREDSLMYSLDWAAAVTSFVRDVCNQAQFCRGRFVYFVGQIHCSVSCGFISLLGKHSSHTLLYFLLFLLTPSCRELLDWSGTCPAPTICTYHSPLPLFDHKVFFWFVHQGARLHEAAEPHALSALMSSQTPFVEYNWMYLCLEGPSDRGRSSAAHPSK